MSAIHGRAAEKCSCIFGIPAIRGAAEKCSCIFGIPAIHGGKKTAGKSGRGRDETIGV